MKLSNIALMLVFVVLTGKTTLAQNEKEKEIKFAPDPEMIPSDFDPNKHVLLVMHMPNRKNPELPHVKATEDLNEIFGELYIGYKYIIVSPADLRGDSSKYMDTSVYRYILYNDLMTNPRIDGGYTMKKYASTGLMTSTPNAPIQVRHTVIDFYFYDRAVNKKYVPSGWPNGYVKNVLRPIILTMMQHGRKKKAA